MKYLLYLRELIKKEKIAFFLKSFGENETLTPEMLKNLQSQKLKNLLLYLEKHNHFYSKYFLENNIAVKKIDAKNATSILNQLPVIDKPFIKKNTNEWLSKNPKAKITKATTSGSTGMPFEIFHSAISRDIKASQKFRLFKWHGINRWEKQFYFGCTYGPPKTKINELKVFLNDHFVFNKHVIDFTEISKPKIDAVINRINKEKPVSIWGYPSVIYEIARHSISSDKPIDNKNLKLVVSSGESLSEHMKKTISNVFMAKIADEYNSNEGFLAGTCEQGKLHLMEDTLIAEVLKEDGSVSNSGFGELLVTFLYSFDFPFIRYNIGDLVNITEDKCECGRVFKVINSIEGRKGSIIYNGKEKISNATCNHYVTKSPYIDTIHQYQVIQNDHNSVTVKLVVTDKNRDYAGFEKLMSGLFYNLIVHFEYVSDIPRHKSGKFVDVINNIKE